MNLRNKLCYMVLGATIMLLGIAVESIFSPLSVAQQKQAFGEIECRKLTVVDDKGNPAVILGAVDGGAILVLDETGNTALSLSSGDAANRVIIYDRTSKPGILLASDDLGNRVTVLDKENNQLVFLIADDKGTVTILDKSGNIQWEAP